MKKSYWAPGSISALSSPRRKCSEDKVLCSGAGIIAVTHVFPRLGVGTSDVETVYVHLGRTPVDRTVYVRQSPVERGTSIVFDPLIYEGEHTRLPMSRTSRCHTARAWWRCRGFTLTLPTVSPAGQGGCAGTGGTIVSRRAGGTVGGTP